MASLGYCGACGKLVPIIPGPYTADLRSRRYFPVAHEAPNGKPCSGHTKGI